MRAKRVWLGTVATAAVVAAVVLLRRPGGRELAPSCPECRIHIEPHLQLDAGLRGVLAPPSAFAKDSRGRYYVAPTVERGQIAVYGADGALRTIIGRYGPGPGEVGEVQMLAIGANDSLWVVDDRQRVSVFSPDGTFARSFQHTSLIFDFTLLPGPGAFVASTWAGSRSPALVFLYRSDSQPYELTKAPRGQELGSYRLAASDDSTVVVVSESYAVTVFNGQSKETSFAPAPDWFAEPLPGTRSPRGHVIDIEAKDSLLWVYYRERHSHVASSRESRESEGPTRIGPQDILAGNTFYLDVLDVRKRQLVARTAVRDWFIVGLLGDDVIARREVDAGVEEVWVLRVKLAKP